MNPLFYIAMTIGISFLVATIISIWYKDAEGSKQGEQGQPTVCFNTQDMANQFLQDTKGGGGYIITVPCPAFNTSQIPADESGK
jgi:hypothetical protein